MRQSQIIILCMFSSLLLGEEELYDISTTQYIQEEGVISEPTIQEYLQMDKLEEVKFISDEPKTEQTIYEDSFSLPIEEKLPLEKSSDDSMFTYYDDALRVAKEENKIVILEVVSNDCPFCIRMEEEVLSTERVKDAIKKDFVLAKANGDNEPLPLGLSAQMTPMYIFISKSETVLDMRFGYIKENDFLKLLDEESKKK